ncbi:unnamed protein product [Caenorhabditis brenneri]
MLIAISTGCAPSVPSDDPIVTTTVSSATTSVVVVTTTSSDIILNSTSTSVANTTTTVSTTTIPTTTTTLRPNCCGYPIENVGVNTASPTRANWDNCSQSVSLTCRITNKNEGYIEVSVLGNATTLPASLYSFNQLDTGSEAVTVALTCDTTNRLWYKTGLSQNSAKEYQYVTCLYRFANGSYTVSG